MSRSDVVILSSSSPALPASLLHNVTPPRPNKERVVPSTSSPDSLPSPLAILNLNVDKRLKSGSRASKVLESTKIGFSSASELVKHGHLQLEDPKEKVILPAASKPSTGEETAVQPAPEASKGDAAKSKSKKQSPHFRKLTKPSTTPGASKRPAKQGVSWDIVDEPEDSRPNPLPAAQSTAAPRTDCRKKTMADEENACEKNQVRDKKANHQLSTDGQANTESTKRKKAKRSTGKTSKHFAENNFGLPSEHLQSRPDQKDDPVAPGPAPVVIQDVPILDTSALAPRRRLSWTPPHDTAKTPETKETPVIDLVMASLSPTSAKLDFSGLLQNFGYAGPQEASNPKSAAAPKKQDLKRKRIELIDASIVKGPSGSTVAARGAVQAPEPAVKKKAKLKSVTAIAMERFRTSEDTSSAVEDKMSKFLAPRKEASKSRSTSTAKLATKGSAANGTRRRTERATAKKASKKKAVSVEPPLLAPEEATRHVAKHEQKHGFVFATSSQLYRERSPTMLRAIQQSLAEADNHDSSGFEHIEAIEAEAGKIRGGLWAAASKAEDRMAVEGLGSQDLAAIEEPLALQEQDDSIVIRSENLQTSDRIHQEEEEVFPWGTALPTQHDNATTRPLASAIARPVGIQRGPAPAAAQSFSTVPSTRLLSPGPKHVISRSFHGRAALSTLSTNTSPTKRRRGRPPKAVDTGKVVETTSLPAASVADEPVPKKARGRPRKEKTSEHPDDGELFPTISEIEDSEAESVPSPPRRKKGKQRASPQLDLASSQELADGAKAKARKHNAITATGLDRLRSKHPAWADISEGLFAKITDVVKGTPRGEVGKPSWWEKMLMYDPIVIEDLCAWLDGQGVTVAVRPDREEAQGEGEGNGKETGTVEQWKLKPWMVQKWCEEKSVCCLWKEGLRGGVKYAY